MNSAPQQSNSTTELEAQQVGLSSHAFEQLMSRVSAEVTKTIAPLLATLQSTNQSASPSMLPFTSSQLSPFDQSINLVEEPILLRTAPVQSSGESMVGQLVNTSVNTLNTTIQGEQCAKSRPSRKFHSVGLSLDACIPEKVKTKITSNEYINLGILISNHIQQDNKYQLSIRDGVGDQQSLCLEPSNKTKRIINIESWMPAFHIFVAVYTQKYPTEAPALMKYSDLIQDLASRGHN